MSIQNAVRLFVVAAIVLMPGTAPGQESSLIPTFPALVIRNQENGHLVASFSREADSLTMTVRGKVARPENGWGGVCLENRLPVNLHSYTHMSATIDPSAPVVMDVKLEKTKAEEGTIVLADKESFPRGRKTYTWPLKDAGGTLAETKKLCVFVLSDDFHAAPTRSPSRSAESASTDAEAGHMTDRLRRAAAVLAFVVLLLGGGPAAGQSPEPSSAWREFLGRFQDDYLGTFLYSRTNFTDLKQGRPYDGFDGFGVAKFAFWLDANRAFGPFVQGIPAVTTEKEFFFQRYVQGDFGLQLYPFELFFEPGDPRHRWVLRPPLRTGQSSSLLRRSRRRPGARRHAGRRRLLL